MPKTEAEIGPKARVEVGRKRRSTFKIASAVIDPLADMLEKHPELGYDTTTAAVTQAIVRFTDELRNQLHGAEGPKRQSPADLDHLLDFLRRLAVESKGGDAGSPASKRPR